MFQPLVELITFAEFQGGKPKMADINYTKSCLLACIVVSVFNFIQIYWNILAMSVY
jgi:hypothetical protein